MFNNDKPSDQKTELPQNQLAPREPVQEQSISIDGLRQLSFQYMEDGFAIVDLNGVHVDVNPAFCRMIGFAAKDLVGSAPDHIYWPPEHREQIREAFSETLRGELAQIELTFMRRNGERFPVIVNPFAIRNSNDDILYYATTVVDISQQVAMKAALRESERRFHALFEHAGDAIAIIKDYQIIECNRKLFALYGFSREEITSVPTFDFFPPNQPCGKLSSEVFLEKVAASRAGEPQFYEWHGRKRDGTPVITEVTLTTFMIDGVGFEQAISRDITQRKQMEAALVDLNKTLENRVAQRTEELENACAELLQRNAQFRTLTRKLTQAEEVERKRIARLLHDNHQQLLAAAKFKAEMLQSRVPGADTDKASREIVEILEQALEVTRALTMELAPPILYGQGFVAAMQWLGRWMEENHKLQVVVSGSLPLTPMPTAVSNFLFRAVRELLFNVSKHSGVQKAIVSIALADPGIQVAVTDEGVGFDVADVLQTRSYGLFSIQEQLIPLNGLLDISSVPGCGTRSTLIIPLSDDGEVDAEADPQASWG